MTQEPEPFSLALNQVGSRSCSYTRVKPGCGGAGHGLDKDGAEYQKLLLISNYIYKFICNCLPGFEPESIREWYIRDGSKGCIRKPNVSTCHGGEGFVEMARVKVHDTSMFFSINLASRNG